MSLRSFWHSSVCPACNQRYPRMVSLGISELGQNCDGSKGAMTAMHSLIPLIILNITPSGASLHEIN